MSYPTNDIPSPLGDCSERLPPGKACDLCAAQARLAGELWALPTALTITRRSDDRILAVNEGFERMLGYRREEAEGRTAREIGLYEHPESRDASLRPIEKGDEATFVEQPMRSKSGELRTLLLSIRRIAWAGESCLLTQLVDLTESKRAEARLIQSQKLEALGVLAGGIAHDFNNILTAVLNYTTLAQMEDPHLSPETRAHLSEVQRAGNRARDLVGQILAFSQRQKQLGGAERMPVRLASVVRDAMSLLRATMSASIDLQHDYDPGTPQVLGDPTQLHQVVMNLGVNAMQAIGDGVGRVTMELGPWEGVPPAGVSGSARLPEGRYTRLVVSDTGCGIESSMLGDVFEPFFTTKRERGGTGLGLAVVQSIVKDHGGVIDVRSTPGAGSVFEVYLPALKEDEPFGADASVENPVVRPGCGQRVLLVDDDVTAGRSMGTLLTQLGYEAVVFSEPERALASVWVAPSRFDLAIIDARMPGMSGIVLAKKIHMACADLPLVLMTGMPNESLSACVGVEGVVELVTKPVTLGVLVELLLRVLAAAGPRKDA